MLLSFDLLNGTAISIENSNNLTKDFIFNLIMWLPYCNLLYINFTKVCAYITTGKFYVTCL